MLQYYYFSLYCPLLSFLFLFMEISHPGLPGIESEIVTQQVDPDQLIEDIAHQLDLIGYGDHIDVLGKMFRGIFTVIGETRQNIANYQDSDGTALLKVEIDTSVVPPEIQLSATLDTRGPVKRFFHIGERPQTEIMVFTPGGYRPATPETLESHRYMAGGHNHTSRAVPYSKRASSSIEKFLKPFHERFKP